MISKKKLQENVNKTKGETKDALQTMYDALSVATNWLTYANRFQIKPSGV